MIYEKRCDICGKPFIARNKRQHVCYKASCQRENRRLMAIARRAEDHIISQYELDTPEPHIPKPDTIVAIGYAERQMAETLKMAGKVKV